MLTVYGIETGDGAIISADSKLVATVLTVYGIETPANCSSKNLLIWNVATVLTVYGIETGFSTNLEIRLSMELQQCLPFTVLKRYNPISYDRILC